MKPVRHITYGLILLLVMPAFAQLILISRSQEIEIGKEVAAAIEKQYGVWDDPVQSRRVERIGRSLVAVCERKDMPYSFKILNERKELNAFAAPGGPIYITRALLEALESDDEVAFVLGHEIGHVAGDHIRKQISQAIAGSLLLDILTGGSSQLVRLGSDIMFSLYQSGYSRQHERDADTRGVRYMRAAGYNPVAAITALRKLGMERYRGLVKWFGTHPDVPSRINRIAQMLGVDPETLQPLPKGATLDEGNRPNLPVPLFYIADRAVFRLSPKAAQPQKVWELADYLVERIQVAPDGKSAWLLVRRHGSNTVLLALWQEQSRRTEFLASIYAPSVLVFLRAPQGEWLAILAQDGPQTFVKVFDPKGQEVPLPDRTPLGKIVAIDWSPDRRLVMITERFGEAQMVVWRPKGIAQFVPLAQPDPLTQISVVDHQTLVALGNGSLHQGRWRQESLTWQPLSSGVSAFAIRGERIALVKDGQLQVGKLGGNEWKIVDQRTGIFAELTLSPNGEWLAYTYREGGEASPQLWVAHLPTQRLWRLALNATNPVFPNP